MRTDRVEIVTRDALRVYLESVYSNKKVIEIFEALDSGSFDSDFIKINQSGTREYIAYEKRWYPNKCCELINIVDIYGSVVSYNGLNCPTNFIEKVKIDSLTGREKTYTVLDITDKNINTSMTKKEILKSAIRDISSVLTDNQIESIITAINETYNIELK